jgi:hypothetical protein
MTRLCRTCHRPINRGGDPAPCSVRCMVCLVGEALLTLPRYRKEKKHGLCTCGCGREGIIMGKGLVSACYQRAWRAR